MFLALAMANFVRRQEHWDRSWLEMASSPKVGGMGGGVRWLRSVSWGAGDTQHVRKSGAARSHPGPGLRIYFSRRHERVVQFAIAPRISAQSSSPLFLKMS